MSVFYYYGVLYINIVAIIKLYCDQFNGVGVEISKSFFCKFFIFELSKFIFCMYN